MLRFALVALSSALAVVTTSPRSSDACTQLPGWVTETNWQIFDIPTRGIIPIKVETLWDEDPFAVEVRDMAGDVVPGTFELVGDSRLVWRSDAPLEPSTQYIATVSDEFGFGDVELMITTAAADLDIEIASEFTDQGIRQHWVASYACCTNDLPGSCGTEEEDPSCYVAAYSDAIRVRAQLIETELQERFRVIEESSRARVNGSNFSWIISDSASRYCRSVRLRNLQNNEVTSLSTCQDDADAVAVDRPDLGTPNPDYCEDVEPPLPPTGDGEGGCNASNGSSSFGLALLIGLLAFRRRRSR